MINIVNIFKCFNSTRKIHLLNILCFYQEIQRKNGLKSDFFPTVKVKYFNFKLKLCKNALYFFSFIFEFLKSNRIKFVKFAGKKINCS